MPESKQKYPVESEGVSFIVSGVCTEHALIVPLMVQGGGERILILRNKDKVFVGAINGAFTLSRFQEAIVPPP